jgi:hypothetical protein
VAPPWGISTPLSSFTEAIVGAPFFSADIAKFLLTRFGWKVYLTGVGGIAPLSEITGQGLFPMNGEHHICR